MSKKNNLKLIIKGEESTVLRFMVTVDISNLPEKSVFKYIDHLYMKTSYTGISHAHSALCVSLEDGMGHEIIEDGTMVLPCRKCTMKVWM